MKAALQEPATAATEYRIVSLKNQATQAQNNAQWQQAVKHYEDALKLDSSLAFAQQNLPNSRARAKLDGDLRSALGNPNRLSDTHVFGLTEQLLASAQNVANPGPVLQQQIAQLGSLLQQAAIPVSVTLRSDSQTEVTVYKVGKLGRFDSKTLELRPGSYTAVGIRNGYRDVRQSFTLSHNSPAPTITLICSEPI